MNPLSFGCASHAPRFGGTLIIGPDGEVIKEDNGSADRDRYKDGPEMGERNDTFERREIPYGPQPGLQEIPLETPKDKERRERDEAIIRQQIIDSGFEIPLPSQRTPTKTWIH